MQAGTSGPQSCVDRVACGDRLSLGEILTAARTSRKGRQLLRRGATGRVSRAAYGCIESYAAQE